MLEGIVSIEPRCSFKWGHENVKRMLGATWAYRKVDSWNLNARKRRGVSSIEENSAQESHTFDENGDSSLISSPMDTSAWKWKEIEQKTAKNERNLGRGRSAKRSGLYQELSSYHSTFLSLLTAEYRVEVK